MGYTHSDARTSVAHGCFSRRSSCMLEQKLNAKINETNRTVLGVEGHIHA